MKFLRLPFTMLPGILARLETTARCWAIFVGGLALLSLPSTAGADPDPATPREEILARYPWPEVFENARTDPQFAKHAALVDPLPAGTTGTPEGKVALRISADKTEPLRLHLLTVPNPPVTADFYALAGQVKYEGVEGNGYLEMWSTFPPNVPGGPERSFFSRTPSEVMGDPMEGLHGTSAWRPVVLPFNAAGAGARPTSLTVNLILPAGGTVYLAPLHLAQYHYGPSQTAFPSAAHTPGWPGWKILTTVAAVFLALVPGWVIWRTAHRRRAAEWRRMAAHDASVH